MAIKEIEERMRNAEWFHSLRIPDGMWIVLRMDGRCFSKLTAELKHPFDHNFNVAMMTVSEELIKELDGIYCETHSDEISLLLKPNTDMFDREVEKLVSVSASLASSHFTRIRNTVCSFDSRIVMFPTIADVTDYFIWRQFDANRCCINSICYWKLRKDRGLSRGAATSQLKGMSINERNAFLFEQFGINYTNDVPDWQKRGIGMYWKEEIRDGWNPILKQEVAALRRVIFSDQNLPYGNEYRQFLHFNIHSANLVNKWCFYK